jgi:phosphomannomutase/phosphoglucomutase
MLVQSISGIRGIFGEDINPGLVRRFALAYYQAINKKTSTLRIVIGTDTRSSAEKIKREFFKVLTSYDTEIFDLGIAPTPAVQLAVREYKADGGIIITASHNPPEFNGFKFLNAAGTIVDTQDLKSILEHRKNIKSMPMLKPDFGKILDYRDDANEIYVSFLLKLIGKESAILIKNLNQKIILDSNGGAAIKVLDKLFGEIGLDVISVNKEAGKFERAIEPNKESLRYLTTILDKKDGKFAAGFDCDADRVELILKDGTLVSGNHILSLIVRDLLNQNTHPEQQIIVVNDATSYMVRDIVEKFHATFREVEVGELNVVREMYRVHALAGGEGSNGGCIIPPSTCRDGILTLLFMLKIIAKSRKSLSQLISELPQYYWMQQKIRCDPKIQVGMKNRLKKHFLSHHYSITETGDHTGGLKILVTKDAWIWYRMSKTEPGVFRIATDARDEQQARRLMKEAIYIFNQFKN